MHGVNNLRQFAIFGRSVWHKFRTTSLPKIRFEVLVAGIHRPLTIYVRWLQTVLFSGSCDWRFCSRIREPWVHHYYLRQVSRQSLTSAALEDLVLQPKCSSITIILRVWRKPFQHRQLARETVSILIRRFPLELGNHGAREVDDIKALSIRKRKYTIQVRRATQRGNQESSSVWFHITISRDLAPSLVGWKKLPRTKF